MELFSVIILLIFISPVILIIASLIILDGGPVLTLSHGLRPDGTRFGIWRFRTTGIGSRSTTQTGLGRWLRWSALDELPRLFPVLTGTTRLAELARQCPLARE